MQPESLADLVWDNPAVEAQRFDMVPKREDLPVWESGVRWGIRVARSPFALRSVSFEDAKALWTLGAMTHFRPVPRPQANVSADCVDHYWCLWLDIDDLDGLRRVNKHLKPRGFVPSAVVFSGQAGFHVYFRLAVALSIDLIEPFNYELARLVGGDIGSSPSPHTYMRIPGTCHHRSGKIAELLELNDHVVAPEVLNRVKQQVLHTVIDTRADSERRWQQAELRHGEWDRRLRQALLDRERAELKVQQRDARLGIAFAELERMAHHIEGLEADLQEIRTRRWWQLGVKLRFGLQLCSKMLRRGETLRSSLRGWPTD